MGRKARFRVYVVEGGRARTSVTALATPAEVQENQPAPDLLWHVRFRWKPRPRQVTENTKYGTVANIAALERERIHAYVPLSALGQRAGKFPGQGFAYDAATDAYGCPGGHSLRFLSYCQAAQRRISTAPAAACGMCTLRPHCTTAQRGRRVGQHLEKDALERVRSHFDTETYAKAIRKRQVWVEPLFAEAKEWRGLRRFRLLGLEQVNDEALLMAAGHNLKRLLSRRGWGRRPFPTGPTGVALFLRFLTSGAIPKRQ